MAKVKVAEMHSNFEHPAEQEPGRRFGILAIIVVLTIVGILIWLMMSRDDSN